MLQSTPGWRLLLSELPPHSLPVTAAPLLQSLKRKGCGPGSSSERTRTAITGALKKKLKDLMGEFQDLRSVWVQVWMCVWGWTGGWVHTCTVPAVAHSPTHTPNYVQVACECRVPGGGGAAGVHGDGAARGRGGD